MPDLPNLAQIIAPVLERVPAAERPLLIALAERLAADRYRDWAGGATDAARAARLLACAEREEEIARRVEALFPDPAGTQRAILARNPDLPELNAALFRDRPPAEQWAIQASGERLGAATWRAFAGEAPSPHARETFLHCATLEEESAAVLEAILAGAG